MATTSTVVAPKTNIFFLLVVLGAPRGIPNSSASSSSSVSKAESGDWVRLILFVITNNMEDDQLSLLDEFELDHIDMCESYIRLKFDQAEKQLEERSAAVEQRERRCAALEANLRDQAEKLRMKSVEVQAIQKRTASENANKFVRISSTEDAHSALEERRKVLDEQEKKNSLMMENIKAQHEGLKKKTLELIERGKYLGDLETVRNNYVQAQAKINDSLSKSNTLVNEQRNTILGLQKAVVEAQKEIDQLKKQLLANTS